MIRIRWWELFYQSVIEDIEFRPFVLRNFNIVGELQICNSFFMCIKSKAEKFINAGEGGRGQIHFTYQFEISQILFCAKWSDDFFFQTELYHIHNF